MSWFSSEEAGIEPATAGLRANLTEQSPAESTDIFRVISCHLLMLDWFHQHFQATVYFPQRNDVD